MNISPVCDFFFFSFVLLSTFLLSLCPTTGIRDLSSSRALFRSIPANVVLIFHTALYHIVSGLLFVFVLLTLLTHTPRLLLTHNLTEQRHLRYVAHIQKGSNLDFEKSLDTHKWQKCYCFLYRTERFFKRRFLKWKSFPHIFTCRFKPRHGETLAHLFSITRLRLMGKSWKTALRVICLLFHGFYPQGGKKSWRGNI